MIWLEIKEIFWAHNLLKEIKNLLFYTKKLNYPILILPKEKSIINKNKKNSII